MIGTALVGACIVTVAVLGAVVTPLLADEEGQGLRVLSNVGNNAVLAHAAVGQIVGIARVRLSGHRGDSGLLEADERALCLVLLAPIISVAFGNRVWVNSVGVVVLG